MNPRILRGLLFEHVTRTWPFFAAALGLFAFYAATFALGSDEIWQFDLEPGAQVMTLFIAAIGLVYSTSDGERMTSEIPQRSLLLPVPTFTLVAVRIAFSISAIAALSLVVHATLAMTVGGPRDAWWIYPVSAISTMALIQTLGFATGCLGDWSLGILFASWLAVIPFLDELLTETIIMESAPVALGFMTPIVATSILISAGIVHLRRTGRWDPELLLSRRATERTRTDERDLPPFVSPMAAQRWFEARRMRNYFWVTFVCSTLLVGTANVVSRIGTERFLEDYSTAERMYWGAGQFGMMLPFMFMLSALFTGTVMLLQNLRLVFGPMSAFLFLRPMSTADLARGRLLGTARGLATPFALTVGLSIALCSAWGLINETNPLTLLTDRYSAIEILGILAIIAVGVGAAAWAVYWTALVCFGVIG